MKKSNKFRVYINYSRSGHYTLTVRDRETRRVVYHAPKLPSVERARSLSFIPGLRVVRARKNLPPV